MATAGGRLTGLSVLVVEDESVLGLYFVDLLQAEGCTVVGPVSSVTDALQALNGERPDAAILDLNLHGEPSFAVAQALASRKIAFVVVSGSTEDRYAEPALRSAPFLEKPFLAAQLIKALHDITKRSRCLA